jgi:hypothetical protein
MDLRLVQFLSQCREEEREAIDRWFQDFQPIALTNSGSMSFARGTTRLADLLGTTDSVSERS